MPCRSARWKRGQKAKVALKLHPPPEMNTSTDELYGKHSVHPRPVAIHPAYKWTGGTPSHLLRRRRRSGTGRGRRRPCSIALVTASLHLSCQLPRRVRYCRAARATGARMTVGRGRWPSSAAPRTPGEHAPQPQPETMGARLRRPDDPGADHGRSGRRSSPPHPRCPPPYVTGSSASRPSATP